MVHKDIWRNGTKLVSVTELQSIISKPFLEKWKESLCQPGIVCGFDAAKHVAEEAAALGNAVHEDVENWFSGGLPQTDWGRKIVLHYEAAQVRPVLIKPEESMIDEESGLAGSPDAVIEGVWDTYTGKAISDLKIKNQLDTLTGMQFAGYRYLLRRKTGIDINKGLIMWCQKKSAKLLVKPVWVDLDEWTAPFKTLVAMWNVLNKQRTVTLHD